MLVKKAANKYINRVEQKMAQKASKPEKSYVLNPTDEIFKGNPLDKAVEIEETLETIDNNENIKNVKKNKMKKMKKSVVAKKVKAKSVKSKNLKKKSS